MERDIERLIQRKVREAERQPVAWRKEQVWANINTGLQPKKADHRIFYNAAACVVLLITASLFFIMPNHHGDHMRSTSQSESPANTATPDSIGSVPTPIAATRPEKVIIPRKHNITMTTELTVPKSSAVEEEIISLPSTDTLVSESVAEIIQPQQKHRIKPVIGVFDPTEPEQEVAIQKKRRKLPLLKPGHDDSTPLENPSETIIARIH